MRSCHVGCKPRDGHGRSLRRRSALRAPRRAINLASSEFSRCKCGRPLTEVQRGGAARTAISPDSRARDAAPPSASPRPGEGPGLASLLGPGRGPVRTPGDSTWDGGAALGPPRMLPRKEVIQPQLPLRLPCYDFVPVTRPTLGRCPPGVGPRTSGVAGSHDVTGGVYKAREQIHRGMADPRLLATPTSRGRVAAPDPNWDRVWGSAPPRGFAPRCPGHCSVRVAQAVRAMRT